MTVNPAWTLVTGPALEPVTLSEAKLQVREVGSAEDTNITRYIAGGRDRIEQHLNRGLLAQTMKYTQDVWTDEIPLPRAPLQSVTAVQYYDASGTLVTLSSSVYLVDTVREPGCIYRAPNQVWPVLHAQRPSAVVITYVVGYASVGAIPPSIIDALMLLITDSYAHRGDDRQLEDVPGVTAKLAPHRVWWAEPHVA